MTDDVAGGNWLSLVEAKDVLASLRHLSRCLDLVGTDPTAWKWAIIALHNALQGAMTCHLSGTAGLGCLSKASACSQIEWHERDRRGEIHWLEAGFDELGLLNRRPASRQDERPREYMATPQTLFDRLHKERLRIETGCGGILPITLSQRRSFRLLNGLRNQFAHFIPLGWSVELSGLPAVFGDMLAVIGMIKADSWPFRRLNAGDDQALDSLLELLSQRLDEMI